MRSRSFGWTVLLAGLGLAAAIPALQAQQAAPGEAWKSSPFHGVPNAATGKNIPCVCVFRGKEYRLGEAVCMQTHVGTVVTKCDLLLNNTTWAPTTEACNVSQARPPQRFACVVPVPGSRTPIELNSNRAMSRAAG